MRSSIIQKLRATSGLVILTAPLCLVAYGQQGYVDVEAERAAAEAAGNSYSSNTGSAASANNDPYGAQPAQAYPATSYGVSNAPAATSSIAPVSSAPAPGATSAPVAGSVRSGSELGNLFLQIQQLQQEVMRLNGKVEEQAYELNTLKEQSLQRYMDLDKRIGSGAATPAQGGSDQASTVDGAEDSNAGGIASAPEVSNTTPGVEQPGEADAYRAAYRMVQGRQFDQAIPAFQQFLQRYPAGAYAANAHYWLGELYLVKSPPDLEAARQSFALLLSEYPDNSKAPDALYKLGKVQFLKGNSEKAKEYLDLVITQYEGTNNAVVKLARDFIAQNY
ncbi:Cell division coordinator CpoB [Halioglobus japonicus]|nr:Cell division coordinator CpoB [Halioglobus japonicus]